MKCGMVLRVPLGEMDGLDHRAPGARSEHGGQICSS